MAELTAVRRLCRYCAVGILTNLVGYGFFLILLVVGTPPVVATGSTYLVFMGVSYYANRSWTFRSNSTHARDLLRFGTAHSIGFVVSVLAMHLMAPVMGPAIAQAVVIVIAAIAIYVALVALRFGRVGGDVV